jgi:Concanavalin A-like lectin/glucanases superfamily/Domain of unknown function (DUF2341)
MMHSRPHRKRRHHARFFQGALALLLAGCLGNHLAGGGSEATNGNIVAGRLEHADGTAAPYARIWVRPTDYLMDTAKTIAPQSVPDAVADEQGRFVLDSLPAGTYLLEAREGGDGGYAEEPEAKGVTRYLSVADAAIQLPPDTLRPIGILEGRLERLGKVPQKAYARIYGLDRVAAADSTGHFAFRDLPAGQYRIQGVSSLPGHGFQNPAPVLIYPQSGTRLPTLPLIRSADEDYSDWPFSRQIILSTETISAGERVSDFPLLIRLHAGNFDFSQSSGSDIRFSAADGSHLAYEVESWDAQASQAEIWVLLDSIVGGGPLTFNLHWGRPQAPDFSFGPAVFSTFGGVWHLQARPNLDGEMESPDASPGAAKLTGQVDVQNRSGAIGFGAGFKGAQVLTAAGHGALWPERSFMVSSWIQLGKIPSTGAGVLSLGDNYVLRIEPSGTVRFFYYNDSIAGAEPLLGPWVDATTAHSIRDTTQSQENWHLVAAALNDDSLRIYIDGVQRAASRARGPATYSRGTDLFIGVHGDLERKFPFHGQIDEVRVSGLSRSPAWMKLAYENQKPGSAMLTFR